MLEELLRRTYDPAALLASHPPVLRHPHKRMVFDLACPAGAIHSGPITVTRWAAAALPTSLELAATTVVAVPGTYDYRDRGAGVWHVNFADPELFFAYGSPLLAQDELQAAEHPLLGSIREVLGADARTEDARTGAATPVLVANVERRCAIDTRDVYGNRFARCSADQVRAATQVLDPPTASNLIAIAAPGCGRGRYRRDELERVLVTAYTGFAAAKQESGAPVEVHTGFWGCGAFGGNRRVMTMLQILAARLAGLDRLVFHVFDDAGAADFRRGADDLGHALEAATTAEALDRIEALRLVWGTSDGT